MIAKFPGCIEGIHVNFEVGGNEIAQKELWMIKK